MQTAFSTVYQTAVFNPPFSCSLFLLVLHLQDLVSEVSRCMRLVKGMKQKGPLEKELIDKVKALNAEVIAFKSKAF